MIRIGTHLPDHGVDILFGLQTVLLGKAGEGILHFTQRKHGGAGQDELAILLDKGDLVPLLQTEDAADGDGQRDLTLAGDLGKLHSDPSFKIP